MVTFFIIYRLVGCKQILGFGGQILRHRGVRTRVKDTIQIHGVKTKAVNIPSKKSTAMPA